MRAALAVIATILVLAATFAQAGAPTFTVCDASNSLLENAEVTTADPSWSSGKTVHFTIKGTLKEQVTGANVHTLAYFDGIEVENKDDNMCTYEGTPFTCPEPAGPMTKEFPFAIPSVPWSGELSSHTEFKTTDGKVMFCLDLKVRL